MGRASLAKLVGQKVILADDFYASTIKNRTFNVLNP